MGKIARLIYDVFAGMNSFIAPEKLPKTVLEHIENYELMTRLGNLKKRRGYAGVIISGITSLKGMYDFTDADDGRQLLIQDGTDIKESVYSGGSYGAVSAITNDKRTYPSQVDQMYPIEYNKEIRSPAGVSSINCRPFIYQYKAAAYRFPTLVFSGSYFGAPVIIPSGKYLNERFLKKPLTGSMFDQSNYSFRISQSGVSDQGIMGNKKIIVYVAPIYDRYMRGIPEKCNILDNTNLEPSTSGYGTSINFHFTIPESAEELYNRITAFDVFIAEVPTQGNEDENNYPAYFLERVEFREAGDILLSFDSSKVTLWNNPGAERVTIKDYAKWLTGIGYGLRLFTLRDKTNDKYYVITGQTVNGTDIELTTDPVIADSGPADIEILPAWVKSGTNHMYPIFYDNYHKKLRSEMYTYLNIPTGDSGLSNYEHKYGVIANGRYFGFGFSDNFAYYSPPNAFDVLCSQNIIIPIRDVVGCAAAGRDVYMFYKNGGSRITVLSNTNIDQDDNFFDVGLVHQKALVQLSDDEFVFMSYKGPYLVQGRQKLFIGNSIKPWFERTGDLPYFTDAQKEACVAGYNHLKGQVWFSFPTYNTSPYSDGIIFVFDIEAYKAGKEPWLIYTTNGKVISFCVTNDLHMLAGGDFIIPGFSETYKVIDFNADNPTEHVSTKLIFNLLKAGKRQKMLFHKLYLDIKTNDPVTVTAYYDGSSSGTNLPALNDDNEVSIKQLKESLKLEITTDATTNDVEFSKMELKLLPRPY